MAPKTRWRPPDDGFNYHGLPNGEAPPHFKRDGAVGRDEPYYPERMEQERATAPIRTQQYRGTIPPEDILPHVLDEYDSGWYAYDPYDPIWTSHYDWPDDRTAGKDYVDIYQRMYPTDLLDKQPEQFEFGPTRILGKWKERPPELPCNRCHQWFFWGELVARTVTWVNLDRGFWRKQDTVVLGVYCDDCRVEMNRMAGKPRVGGPRWWRTYDRP